MSIAVRPAPARFASPRQEVLIGEHLASGLPARLASWGVTSVGVLASDRAATSAIGREVLAALDGDPGLRVVPWHDVPPHTSLDAVRRAASGVGADVGALVAIGGGSASDLAKGVAAALVAGDRLGDHFIRRRPDGTVEDHPLPGGLVPLVAVPTTLSAAEITGGAGITDGGIKHVLWDGVLAARSVLYETSEVNALPDDVVVATGMNAMAHAVEATYSAAGGPVSDAIAEAALDRLVEGLVRQVVFGERTTEARAVLFAGVALSGQALANARVCLHHALAHVLGAQTGAAHGDLNAVLLGHVADLNRPTSVRAQDRCAGIVHAAAARAGLDLSVGPLGPILRALGSALGAPDRLPSLGVEEVDLDFTWAALRVERGLAFNPVPVGPAELRHVLEAAGAVVRPSPAREEVDPNQ